ncbi:iron-containing alcohol dehydrogenase [Paraburkholderia pallida]|uniref:Maleylacetate reductase n=1 Tax=Paraburkholderia pallida TaxID=2547399 RepID=A0A4P7CT64_9BURK|nr:iron-containing alcohol dehydrogenase [Paraburkholderia pallida]QBQ99160.1 maleylacetate reductase [Paraburkholderia pallida]
MHESGTHVFPSMERVIYGKPAAKALMSEVERLGSQRVFVMASRSLNRGTDEIRKIETALGPRFAGLVDGLAQHTSRQDVVASTRAALDAKADLIVAIGGGSVVDAAKITTVCIEHRITDATGLDDFAVKLNEAGVPQPPTFRGPAVRMIAIPSTLSGGEYNAGCLVTDTGRDLKQTFYHPEMMPVSIILDPAILRHAPENLYLGSGTRAMDHAIEALCSPRGNPLVDAVVLQGLEMMAHWLPRSRANREDAEAAGKCQIASWLCSYGLQSRVPMGASHAIGHVLGGTCHVPHYLCTPVMMPAVLRYNEPVTQDAQRALARALGAPGGSAADAFKALCERLGLPTCLRDVDVGRDQFELVARNTMTEFFIYSNPRKVQTPREVLDILELAV